MPDSMSANNLDGGRLERAWFCEDIDRLPAPNMVEFLRGPAPSPEGLTTAAYAIPFFEDGRIALAVHHGAEAHRGISLPGGHIDPGETPAQAAVREALEETGVVVTDIVAVGFIRMHLRGARPPGYKYPFPVSYQQVYAGRAIAVQPHSETGDCAPPVIDHPDLLIPRIHLDRDRAIARCAQEAAYKVGFIPAPPMPTP